MFSCFTNFTLLIYHVSFCPHMNSSSCTIFICFSDIVWISRRVSPLLSLERASRMYRYFLGLGLTFPVLSALFLLCCRCFLSDPCRHPGGHTWSALHLEHLQAIIARESPLRTWYTCCSPHSERGESGEKNVLYLNAHWHFMHSKTSWVSCSYWFVICTSWNTFFLFVFRAYLNILCTQDQNNYREDALLWGNENYWMSHTVTTWDRK